MLILQDMILFCFTLSKTSHIAYVNPFPFIPSHLHVSSGVTASRLFFFLPSFHSISTSSFHQLCRLSRCQTSKQLQQPLRSRSSWPWAPSLILPWFKTSSWVGQKWFFTLPFDHLFFLKKKTIIGMALRVTSAYSSIVIHAARSWSAWSAWSECDLQLEGERRGEDIVDWRAICHDLSLSLLLTLALSSYDWASCWCADGIRKRFCRGTHSCNESQGWDARVSAEICLCLPCLIIIWTAIQQESSLCSTNLIWTAKK